MNQIHLGDGLYLTIEGERIRLSNNDGTGVYLKSYMLRTLLKEVPKEFYEKEVELPNDFINAV